MYPFAAVLQNILQIGLYSGQQRSVFVERMRLKHIRLTRFTSFQPRLARFGKEDAAILCLVAKGLFTKVRGRVGY